jgi:hypothetical protein
MTETQTIEHKHQDGRWLREHIDRDGGITYTSNFDHERMLWEDKLLTYYGNYEHNNQDILEPYYSKYPAMYKAEINMLYEQWQDFVKQGVTLAGWEQWLEWEHNDQQTIRDGRDEIEDDLYDGITECLEQEGFN